jgi:hypothetical protein
VEKQALSPFQSGWSAYQKKAEIFPRFGPSKQTRTDPPNNIYNVTHDLVQSTPKTSGTGTTEGKKDNSYNSEQDDQSQASTTEKPDQHHQGDGQNNYPRVVAHIFGRVIHDSASLYRRNSINL